MLDKEKNTVRCQQEEISVSQTEYQLLLLLLENKGKTVTRRQLLEQVWDNSGNYVNDNTLTAVYKNSLFVAFMTAIFGTLLAYGCALASARSSLRGSAKQVVESTALITNTIPGMVIGIAYMLVFSGTSLQNTFLLIIICNMIHYFSTPYLMIKNALLKLNTSWEATAKLLGDSWGKTLIRIITPNMSSTLLEVFGYYFVNAMVTVSAVIFIAGARTMVITTKIKELQYFMKFNEIFVLSTLILLTNLCIKGVLVLLSDRKKSEFKVKKEKKNYEDEKCDSNVYGMSDGRLRNAWRMFRIRCGFRIFRGSDHYLFQR